MCHRASENGAWSRPTSVAVAPFKAQDSLDSGSDPGKQVDFWGTVSSTKANQRGSELSRLKASPSQLGITSGDGSSQGKLMFPPHSRALPLFSELEESALQFLSLLSTD